MDDERIAQTLHDWPELAEQAGLVAQDFTLAEAWRRKEPERAHVVLRLRSAERSVILKRVFNPVEPAQFLGFLDTHRRAHTALARHPTAHVPALLTVDADMLACVMDCAPGRTVDALCAEATDHAPVLRRAGAWMAAFHRAGFAEDRLYQPRFMVDHLNRVSRALRDNDRRIRGRAHFLRHVRQIPAWARGFKGRGTKSAAKHGDMNLRNILLDGAHGHGIDFSGTGDAPVGFDIARFLLNYVEVFGDLDAIEPGEVVPKAALAAFFDGYDFVGADDPSVGFLLKVQLLTDWARVPLKSEDENMLHLVRFQRIRRIAATAFE